MNKSIAVVLALAAIAIALGIGIYLNRNAAAPRKVQASPAPSDSAGKQLWTCGMHPQVVQDHPGTCPICHMNLTPMRRSATGEANHEGALAVVIDPAVVQNMGVRTAEVMRGPLMKTVRTVGTLEAPEPGLHDITLKVSGWIEKLYANQEGQHLHKGDALFDLYSPDLVVAEEELVGSVKALRALPETIDPSIHRSTEVLVTSAKRKLALLDVPQEDIDGVADKLAVQKTVTFRSPASGAVVEKSVVEGSAVQAGTKLMRIEDHSTLWLDLQVYEDQLALVAVGEDVEATVAAWPGKTFQGSVTFIHPHVDHMTRTATARAILNNPDQSLRPGMYASASILTKAVEDAVQVPREAVIDTGTRQIAFVVQSAGHFEPRNVRMGMSGDDGHVQILDGLMPGETVVTSGQFLLDVESRTTEAIDKLRNATAPATMPARLSEASDHPATTPIGVRP